MVYTGPLWLKTAAWLKNNSRLRIVSGTRKTIKPGYKDFINWEGLVFGFHWLHQTYPRVKSHKVTVSRWMVFQIFLCSSPPLSAVKFPPAAFSHYFESRSLPFVWWTRCGSQGQSVGWRGGCRTYTWNTRTSSYGLSPVSWNQNQMSYYSNEYLEYSSLVSVWSLRSYMDIRCHKYIHAEVRVSGCVPTFLSSEQ